MCQFRDYKESPVQIFPRKLRPYIHHICPSGHVFSLSIHPFIHPSLHPSLLSSLCYPSSIVSVKLILKGQGRIELLRQGRLRILFRNRTIRCHECVSLPSSFSKTPHPSMKCLAKRQHICLSCCKLYLLASVH
jgi:hypothetical protein